jgi:hypothetical protein
MKQCVGSWRHAAVISSQLTPHIRALRVRIHLARSSVICLGEMTFEKLHGNGTGLQGTEINSTAAIEEPEGTVMVVVMAVAVP